LPTVAQEAAIDAITFDDMCGQNHHWGDSLLDTYTDGIVVLHPGRMVYERYFRGAEATHTAHLLLDHQIVCRHFGRDIGA
jgi:hypothetical protein